MSMLVFNDILFTRDFALKKHYRIHFFYQVHLNVDITSIVIFFYHLVHVMYTFHSE